MIDGLLFSIVVPTYNRGKLIVQALESVFLQQFDSYEVLVIDDGSTDDTEQRIQPFLNHRLRYFKLSGNHGVGPARNRGVWEANGQWVIFFDTDNLLLPGALAAIKSRLETVDERVAVILGRSVDMEGRDLPGLRSGGPFTFLDYMRSEVPEALPVVRRDVALQFPFAEDLGTKRECGNLFWMNVGKNGYQFYFMDEVVQRYECAGADRLSARGFLAQAPLDILPCNERVLSFFGNDLKRHNPRRFVTILEKTAFYAAMAGRRKCAARYAMQVFRERPFSHRWPLLLLLSASGPQLATWLYKRL